VSFIKIVKLVIYYVKFMYISAVQCLKQVLPHHTRILIIYKVIRHLLYLSWKSYNLIMYPVKHRTLILKFTFSLQTLTTHLQEGLIFLLVDTCKFMDPEVLPMNKEHDFNHCFSIRPFIKIAQKIKVHIIGSKKDRILFFFLLIIINHQFK
jgi:hypothetical protein